MQRNQTKGRNIGKDKTNESRSKLEFRSTVLICKTVLKNQIFKKKSNSLFYDRPCQMWCTCIQYICLRYIGCLVDETKIKINFKKPVTCIFKIYFYLPMVQAFLLWGE